MERPRRFRALACGLLAIGVFILTSVGSTRLSGQEYVAPRTSFGVPDLNGIWQAIGAHHWNIEPHAASHGPVVELGAIFAVPGGLGIVEGGEIPYTAAARALQRENAQHWVERDPAVKCYMPGIPRATYQPYPFQIVQTEEYILFAYEFASASRVVYMNRPDFEAPVDAWMGHSRGSWEGETLIIDVTAQMPDTWLDRNGNHHSNQIRVVERYTATSPYHLNYEATIEDPETYTRPWSISLPLYRRVEQNMQLLEYKCVEFTEELMYGHLRKDPDLTPTYRPSGYGSAFDDGAPGPGAGFRATPPDNSGIKLRARFDDLRTAYDVRSVYPIATSFTEKATLIVRNDVVANDQQSVLSFFSRQFVNPEYSYYTLVVREQDIERTLSYNHAVVTARYELQDSRRGDRVAADGNTPIPATGTIEAKAVYRSPDWVFYALVFSPR